jgi:formate hydrogenlyase transcriptional activator
MVNAMIRIEKLSSAERKALLSVALLPPPVNLDLLIGLIDVSPVKTLQWLENLVDLKILNRCRSEGVGFYMLKSPQSAANIMESYSESEKAHLADTLVDLFQKSDLQHGQKSLTIAHILYTAARFKPDAVKDLLHTADRHHEKGDIATSTLYYQYILDHWQEIPDPLVSRKTYMDAVLGLIATCGHLKPLDQQRPLLTQARETAIELDDAERQCLINLRLAHVLKTEGNYEEASEIYDKAWKLAERLGRDDLLKQAALFTSDFLFWKGLVADAIARYEHVIGNLEEFPADPATLKACATLGWCYGICGQTARGAGLIEAVLNKAKELRLIQVRVYALLMGVLNFLEARRITEAAALLDDLFQHSEETLGNYILWAGYASKAFILSFQGDLEGCYQYQSKAHAKSKEFGWHHHRGPWNFDYMDMLEDTGILHPEMNYDSEIRRLSDWPDVYMKGVGLRYRAQRLLKKGASSSQIIANLKRSIDILRRAGAKLEIARAQVLLARMFLQQQKKEKARELLEEAYSVLHAVNPELFPEELRPYLEGEKKEDFIINTMLEVSNVIGTVQNRDRLLERIINLLMRLTGAGRGAFFFIGPQNRPELVASRNLDSAIVESAPFRSSYDIILKVINIRREIAEPATSINASGWLLCSPIILRERIIGAIYLDNTLAGLSPPRNIISFLKVVTSQLAIAINNAEAYEEIERLKDRLEDETRFYRMELECLPHNRQIVGESASIKAVQAEIERVGGTDSTVLITGETGSGKELVARAIHRFSAKREGPFIPVNAASLDSGIIASELFGHEKGAFTGASYLRRGRFELADGGSLFLDDIDTIPLDIQARILRTIQEKEFERVGGSKTIKTDFRLIAATNQSLSELIYQGAFRADLYYRLNVFPIHIEPLRERKEDIPLLANHFLSLFNSKMGKNIKKVSGQDMRKLTNYSWPGNVRELKHIIERAVILSDGDYLVLPDLQENGCPSAHKSLLNHKEMERAHILNALKQCGGKVSGPNGAARLLELKPTTLYAKIKKLAINKSLQ